MIPNEQIAVIKERNASRRSNDYYSGDEYDKAVEDCSTLLTMTAAADEVVRCAEAVLTALNVGDVQKESRLHLKLREVMISYRAALRPEGEGKQS